MKKAKFLIYAALAASTVAISSCSDNDVLSEPANEPEGKALIVNPTVLDSRVTPLAKSDFTGFKLYGVQNPNISNQSVGSFIKTGTTNGVDYSGTFGETAADVAFTSTTAVKWPTQYPSNSANFYAFSVQGGSDLTGSGITVNEDVNGWPDGTFSYAAPMSGGYVDLSKQKDIMIASSIGATQTGNDGVVTLPFKHAFAKLTLQMRWNSSEFIKNKSTDVGGGITDNALLWIDYIKFHNIKCNGTYSFTADDGNGGKGLWTVDGDNATIMFKYETPKRFIAQKYTLVDDYLAAHPELGGNTNDPEVLAVCNADPFKVQDLVVGDDAIMIIPQELSAWESGSFSNTTGAFIEIRCLACGISGDYADYITGYADDLEKYIENYKTYEEDQAAGQVYIPIIFDDSNADIMGSVYFPIKLRSGDGFVFEQNKSYNFRLNMATCLQANGVKYLDTVGFDNN